MSKHDPLARQLDEIISTVILPLESAGVDIIDPAFVANEVDRAIDPESTSPQLKTYASTMQIRARVRASLAARHDPVKKAEAYAEFESDDLFGDVLQPFYPAKRVDDSGEKVPVYVRRELLTSNEVDAICQRMERAGNALIRHVDALRAWFKTAA